MAVRIAQALNVKIEELYKVIPQHNFSAILFFINENACFLKFTPQWTYFAISFVQKLLRIRNGGVYVMKDVVQNQVMKGLNWREKLITKLFDKTFIKVYKVGVTYGFNNK